MSQIHFFKQRRTIFNAMKLQSDFTKKEYCTIKELTVKNKNVVKLSLSATKTAVFRLNARKFALNM